MINRAAIDAWLASAADAEHRFDCSEAAGYLRKAAELGSAKAARDLASMLRVGLLEDAAEWSAGSAAKWSALGDEIAADHIGYLRKIADAGSAEARELLDEIEQPNPAETIPNPAPEAPPIGLYPASDPGWWRDGEEPEPSPKPLRQFTKQR